MAELEEELTRRDRKEEELLAQLEGKEGEMERMTDSVRGKWEESSCWNQRRSKVLSDGICPTCERAVLEYTWVRLSQLIIKV